jgi:hypothetical protein
MSTNHLNTERELPRVVRSWLSEDRHESVARVLSTVMDELDTTPQRRSIWVAWRLPALNKIVPIGLGAAALVVALVLGTRLLGSPNGGVGTVVPTPSPTPHVTPAAPSSPSGDAGLDEGQFLVSDNLVPITVEIASPGWTSLPQFEALSKGEDDLDPPEGTSAALLAWSTNSGVLVYGDPCHWKTTIPNTPALKAADIAASLAAQPSRNASEPVDVTVGGFHGQFVTLHVAIDAPTRAEAFAECDDETFGSYTYDGESRPVRYHQGPGQIDEMWILDVYGGTVILDASYSPNTPAALVDEVRALAKSATFN